MTKQITGLTDKEVEARLQRGLDNHTSRRTSRSLLSILRGNILTPFNALITALAAAIWLVGSSPINSLFFIAMLLNIVVGIVQEIKAKIVLDRLSIMVKPVAKVVRNGKHRRIGSEDVVQDDVLVLGLGDQVVADGEVLWSDGLEINESLLTGESDPVAKEQGDQVLSGSFVTSGSGAVRVTNVGELSYSAKLSAEAKQFKRVSSELIQATNMIMRGIACIMVIIVPILIIGQMRIDSGDWRSAVVHVVAAIVGMIPEGLVLLTSMAFLLAVVKLARQKVLVQQLPAVETLARVNVLMLDKTGTLTSGHMTMNELIILGDTKLPVRSVLLTMASRATSPTNAAMRKYLTDDERLAFADEIPFSSSRKWSALRINSVNYVLGAPEIVLGDDREVMEALKQSSEIAGDGYRVMALARYEDWPVDGKLSGKVAPLALVVLSEQIRPDTSKTLSYFKQQGVEIKVISGDATTTVGAVAKRVGLVVSPYDARKLPDYAKQPKEFIKIVRQHNVFGRVTPEQKRQIAEALQASGEVVAMTGDGVNDALALKKADLGIAMASGSSATKAVAEVVLMDDKFSHLPSVLGEGRRVVANIERVANLFIIKNVYTAILALAVTVLGLAYPFQPSQITVLGALSIGIPAFFLALAPNNRRYQPGFLRRVLGFSVPTGAAIAVAMFSCYYILLDIHHVNQAVASTSTLLTTMAVIMATLFELSRPVRGWKLGLIIMCGATFVLFVLIPPLASLFGFVFDMWTLPTVAIITVTTITLTTVFQEIFAHVVKHVR